MKSVNILFLALFLIGCDQSSHQKVIDGDDVIPPSPSIWSYFTVEGVDSDNDGVRDDFELYVNENYSSPNLRRALKYEAKITGQFMRTPLKFEITELFKELHNAFICIDAVSRGEKIEIIEVHDQYLNNPWRRKRFNEQGKHASSGVYSLGNTSIMNSLSYCNFELVDLPNYLKKFFKDYKAGATEEEIKQFEEIMGIRK